jgi:uncharacterized protein (DUF924 family)
MPSFALAQDILAFWFADACAGPDRAQARSKVWFTHDPQFDAQLASRYGDFPRRARNGEFDAWEQDPQTAAARIVGLDQFPRNLFRGSAEAFSYDACAQQAALAMTAQGQDLLLHPLAAVFVYLPFEHAEDRALQERSVRSFEALQERVEPQWESLFRGFTDYAHRHRAVIARFGRFPHRNAALGRPSTPEETDYLASGGERFGAPSA